MPIYPAVAVGQAIAVGFTGPWWISESSTVTFSIGTPPRLARVIVQVSSSPITQSASGVSSLNTLKMMSIGHSRSTLTEPNPLTVAPSLERVPLAKKVLINGLGTSFTLGIVKVASVYSPGDKNVSKFDTLYGTL